MQRMLVVLILKQSHFYFDLNKHKYPYRMTFHRNRQDNHPRRRIPIVIKCNDLSLHISNDQVGNQRCLKKLGQFIKVSKKAQKQTNKQTNFSTISEGVSIYAVNLLYLLYFNVTAVLRDKKSQNFTIFA